MIVNKGVLMPSIELFLILGQDEENKAYLSFSWQLVKYRGDEMVI